MKKKHILVTILIISLFIIIGIYFFWNLKQNNPPMGDLTPNGKGEIIEHTRYKLAYSEENEQPFWVFYTLVPSKLNKSINRTDDFRPDPLVSTISASLDDYKSSGYDRGHLCPAADMKYDQISISESFYLSNMSPQTPSFNRGIWSKLESLVRTWSITEDSLYVVTGPVFLNNLDTIGPNQVTVPGYYYKIIFDPTGTQKMIAFLLPNANSNASLKSFVVSVDSIEKLTGIDFFSGITDKIETKLEQETTTWNWDFTQTSSLYYSSTQETKQDKKDQISPTAVSEKNEINLATQCLGTAKSTGKRCKSKTTNLNGYCTPHQNQAPKQ